MVCRWYGEYEILLYTCIIVKYFFTEADEMEEKEDERKTRSNVELLEREVLNVNGEKLQELKCQVSEARNASENSELREMLEMLNKKIDFLANVVLEKYAPVCKVCENATFVLPIPTTTEVTPVLPIPTTADTTLTTERNLHVENNTDTSEEIFVDSEVFSHFPELPTIFGDTIENEPTFLQRLNVFFIESGKTIADFYMKNTASVNVGLFFVSFFTVFGLTVSIAWCYKKKCCCFKERNAKVEMDEEMKDKAIPIISGPIPIHDFSAPKQRPIVRSTSLHSLKTADVELKPEPFVRSSSLRTFKSAENAMKTRLRYVSCPTTPMTYRSERMKQIDAARKALKQVPKETSL